MATPATAAVRAIEFGTIGEREVRAMSVAKITDVALYERGVPKDHGINSLLLGTCDPRVRCKTCRHSVTTCPGHWGHMELAQPVYHPLFLDYTVKVLRCVCFFCSQLLRPREAAVAPPPTWAPARRKRTVLAALANALKGKKCPHCGGAQPAYRKANMAVQCTWPAGTEYASDAEKEFCERPFSAARAHEILRHVPDTACLAFGMDPVLTRPENFVLRLLLVPPPIIRPSVTVTEGSRTRGQEDLTLKLLDIQKQSVALAQARNDGADTTKATELLQWHVGVYMDKDGRSAQARMCGRRTGRNKGQTRSLMQRLNGKRGRVRGSLMGKRVNWSSRTVITPGAMLDLHEIGVPEYVAVRQTFPERVTPFNITALQRRVRVGPMRLGGASAVEHTDGTKTDLSMCRQRETLVLRVGDLVLRTLRDGDRVVFNRQPSLRKESMMAHVVRILPGLTFRLSLACTSPYNADFDGDEMNLHVAQSYEAVAELDGLMGVTANLLTPQQNGPVMGLVQDALIAGYLLTSRAALIPRADFFNFTMQARYADRHIPPPAVYRRRGGRVQAFYTGKQLVTYLLPRGLEFAAGGADPMAPDDARVVVRHGELLSGRLTKKHLGARRGSLVHVCALDCSRRRCVEFLSDAQRVFNAYMMTVGFSVGIQDCVVDPATRRRVETGLGDVLAHVSQHASPAHEAEVEGLLLQVLTGVGAHSVSAMRPDNALLTMVRSGSKGSAVNLSQITTCIGQTCVNGRRVQPALESGRTLPCFRPGDASPLSRGFCDHSYMRGLSPQEFYLHAMGGREGLVDTAVKTATTGYISRRLIKIMEDQCAKYDGTVRTSDGSIVVFAYNGDGYDATWLEHARAPLLFADDAALRAKCAGAPPALARRLVALRDAVRRAKLAHRAELDDGLVVPVDMDRLALTVPRGDATVAERAAHALAAADAVESTVGLSGAAPTAFAVMCGILWPPCAADPAALAAAALRRVRRALLEPGTMVGPLAASSLTEPATQMTLNTFHLAGVKTNSTLSVTKGIPRFRELIEGSKKIQTPSLEVALQCGLGGNQRVAAAVSQTLAETRLADLLDGLPTVLHEPDSDATAVATDAAAVACEAALRAAPLEDPSKFVARLPLSRGACASAGVTVTLVRAVLRQALQGVAEVVAVEGPGPWALRLRLLRQLGLPAAAARRAVAAFARGLLPMRANGVPGVSAACPRKKQFTRLRPHGKIAPRETFVVDARGSNVDALFSIAGVDVSASRTNDIFEVRAWLGIEAATRTLYHEMEAVLFDDGNYVNSRHLEQLVRTMTRRGDVCPVSRHGMARSQVPTLQRASFEMVSDVFTEAAAHCARDDCKGVTEAIILGQLAPLGTGAFDVVTKQPPAAAAAAAAVFVGKRRAGRGVLAALLPPPRARAVGHGAGPSAQRALRAQPTLDMRVDPRSMLLSLRRGLGIAWPPRGLFRGAPRRRSPLPPPVLIPPRPRRKRKRVAVSPHVFDSTATPFAFDGAADRQQPRFLVYRKRPRGQRVDAYAPRSPTRVGPRRAYVPQSPRRTCTGP